MSEASNIKTEPLWTVKEVAEFLRVSTSWTYQKVASGELPYVKVGALVRFHRNDIEAYARGEWTPENRPTLRRIE